ncbi:MAG: LysM domain-containing protein [Candidatus Limnocylindrales bacterium]
MTRRAALAALAEGQVADIDGPASGDQGLEPEAAEPTPPPKRPRRRKRKATASVVGAAIDAMDTPDASASDQERTADAEAAEQAAEREAVAAATEPALDTSPVREVEVEPRRGLVGRLLLLVLGVLIVLAIGAGIGFGAATLVPGLTDASPPAVTLPPPTARPTAPPVPTPRPSATPSPSPSPVPSPTPRVHTVKRGENLTQIAARYDTTVGAIVEANGLKNANLIEVGQKLVIPTPAPSP